MISIDSRTPVVKRERQSCHYIRNTQTNIHIHIHISRNTHKHTHPQINKRANFPDNHTHMLQCTHTHKRTWTRIHTQPQTQTEMYKQISAHEHTHTPPTITTWYAPRETLSRALPRLGLPGASVRLPGASPPINVIWKWLRSLLHAEELCHHSHILLHVQKKFLDIYRKKRFYFLDVQNNAFFFDLQKNATPFFLLKFFFLTKNAFFLLKKAFFLLKKPFLY